MCENIDCIIPHFSDGFSEIIFDSRYALPQMKRSPDVNYTAIAFVRVEAPFRRENAVLDMTRRGQTEPGACTDDKE
jgi:hypothetical protein